MNQRVKRAKNRKQDISGSTINTGGHITSHSRGNDPVVRIPQKTTGDVPLENGKGVAKASPFFQELKKVLPQSKSEEQKAIAESTEEVDKKKDEKEDSE